MPVVWNTASCDPPTPTSDRDGEWRDVLIAASGLVGLSRVTADNLEEWLWRMAFLRRVLDPHVGCLVFANRKGGYDTTEIGVSELRRWVGLYTNWGTDTRQAWVRRWTAWLEKKADAAVQAAIREDATPGHGKAKTKRRRVKA